MAVEVNNNFADLLIQIWNTSNGTLRPTIDGSFISGLNEQPVTMNTNPNTQGSWGAAYLNTNNVDFGATSETTDIESIDIRFPDINDEISGVSMANAHMQVMRIQLDEPVSITEGDEVTIEEGDFMFIIGDMP